MEVKLEGKKYIVKGKRKVFGEYAFRKDAEEAFEALCKKHWKRSFYIIDTTTHECIADRHVFIGI